MLTFSFPSYSDLNSWYWSSSGSYGSDESEPWGYYATGLTSREQSAVTSALSTWSAVADIKFIKVADNYTTVGDLRFAWTDTPDKWAQEAQAWAYFPSSAPEGGDVWLSQYAWWEDFGLGTYDYTAIVHEIGHALGLSHTFIDPNNPGGKIGGALPATEDGYHYSIMSYSALAGEEGSWAEFNPTTPMLYDIAAIQYLYGANTSYHTGDDIYVFVQGKNYFQTIWDAGGNDTIIWAATSESATIDLRPGAWSDLGNTLRFWNSDYTYVVGSSNNTVAIYYTVTIENVTGGSGNDWLIGNDVANVLNGGMGKDLLEGGLGDDTYVVDNAGDVVTELLGGGTDTVRSGISYVLGNHLEHLTLTGTAALNGTGNGLDNTLTGNSGANVLDGGAGADTLIGGLGNDTYLIGAGDNVVEGLNGGTDYVLSDVSHTLGANVEHLTLTGSDAINGTGNELNNTLTGNSGANILDGGAGIDSLLGGLGNDTYRIDLTAANLLQDSVTEKLNEGTDTIELRGGNSALLSTVTLTLGANLEHLDASATGGTRLNLTGNGFNNTLTGNDAANVLDGGLGADTLIGGLGNDTYVVDNAGDVVTELLGGGTDTVRSGISYVLGNHLEHLTLTGTALNGTGNGLDNTLTGNSGANVLDGGAGADTLIGGLGNDSYVVDNAGDLVIEGVNAGTDTVYASLSYVLGANVEHLTLTGSGAIDGTGNALNNTLTGNSGANVLTGGLGNDTYLIGAGDSVVEGLNGGTDYVLSDVSHTLGANVEHLTLTGSDAINGTGNELNNTLTGNSGANILDGGAGIDSLLGGLGNDTYRIDLTAANLLQDSVTEKLNEGTDTIELRGGNSALLSTVTLTLGANLEHLDASATGGTRLNLTGNGFNNTLTGNDAANVLDGGLGADTLIGGLGNDTYVVDNAGDVVTELLGGGTDTVRSGISYVLGNHLEHLTLTGTALNGTGNGLDNTLTGNSGANVLDGGAGADTLIGGLGNDSYVVDNAGDLVIEGVNAGTDTVYASLSYVLGANVEHLTLTGSGAIDGTGNALNNTLTGNSGANVLTGGLGNDTYLIGAGDNVVEGLNGGTDYVLSDVSHTLGANVEHLTLTGSDAINGTGNELNNTLTGNSGANILDGGAGIDSLLGGLGNDTYRIDLTAANLLQDSVTEKLNEGTDTIELRGGNSALLSTVTLTLGANLEHLDASATGGTRLNLTGNGFNNTLTGNDAANVLDGGLGADTLIGGLGNDTYVVDNAGDVVTELLGGGTDTVRSGISYVLGNHLEHLTLTGTALNGTGNGLDNTLTGNSGANVLDGGAGADTLIGGLGNDTLIGGDGADILTGGGGADRFVFNTADALIHFDTITDFSIGVDRICLSSSVFSGLGSIGQMIGLGDHLLYDAGAGTLAYDADGIGGDAGSIFAVLGNVVHPATLGMDFMIVV
ncbi:MAG: M10 family metallopeptidase C-terminal domain-containing protein [Propionivibrio sp.]